MIERAHDRFELWPERLIADTGYGSAEMLDWLVNDGQQYAVNLHYAKLPSNMVANDIAALKGVTSGGSALLKVSS